MSMSSCRTMKKEKKKKSIQKAKPYCYTSHNVSKLLELLAARELADKTKDAQPLVIINYLNPGFCVTELSRSMTGMAKQVMGAMQAAFAWTAEEGSRTLVLGTIAGKESHGAYLSDGAISP